MADIQVLRKTPVTVTETFAVDNVPSDLDVAPPTGVPTVVATAPDGTTSNLTASGAWTGRTTGQFRVVLPAQAEVTWRDLAWTGTIGGQPLTLESRVEWVGALLFTAGQFRALRVGNGTPFATNAVPLISDAQILDTRAEVLDEFEAILGFSPVTRFYRETVSVGWGGDVVLSQQEIRRIISVTAGGVAQVAANFYVAPGRRLLPVSNYVASPWTAYGYGAVTVEYAAGWERPRGDLGDISMLRAAMKLNPGLGSTASTITTPDGASYSFDPAGQVVHRGWITYVRHFGVPAIDAWLNRHASPLSRVGAA